MKSVILAAGKGTRIGSVTEGHPKSLLPLGETTLLGHSLQNLHSQGINDIIVVVGHKREMIMDYVNDNWPGNVEYIYNPHYENTNVLYSFWLATPYLIDSDFIFLHADTVFSKEILSRLMNTSKTADMIFAVDNHPCEEEEMKVQISDGVIKKVNKEMNPQNSDGEFLGLAYVSNKLINQLRYHAEFLFEEKQMGAFFELAVQRMIDQDGLSVKACDVTGLNWQEIDFPEDYELARSLFNRT